MMKASIYLLAISAFGLTASLPALAEEDGLKEFTGRGTNEIRMATSANEESFQGYINGYQVPELFQNNQSAFAARLKLLDQAPAGSTAKILTFVFDNGEVVRRLATHVCLAARRGVKVTVMADSKSGDRPFVTDVFDAGAANRVNEETYQYMANCGARVLIHNHLAHFNRLFGKAIPRVTKKHDNFVAVIYRLRQLANSTMDIVKEEVSGVDTKKELKEKLDKAGLNREFMESIKPEVYRLLVAAIVSRDKGGRTERNFWEKVLVMIAKAPGLSDPKVNELLDNPGTAPQVFDEAMANLHEKLHGLQLDGVSPKDIGDLLERLKAKFKDKPELVAFYEHARRFNRLNHRKLFLVESPAKQGCMFLGGRNLGDHYLAWHHDSFIDGDVLYCRHHGKANRDILADASSSFDELYTALHDDVLAKKDDSPYTEFKQIPGFQFKLLYIPVGLNDPISSKKPLGYVPEKEVPMKDRQLIAPAVWKDLAPIHAALLPHAEGWQVHRVGWQPSIEDDPVRQALINGIKRETQEAYIETAYAEFDDTLRDAVEAALDRGVNVRLITNGLFVSDGPSKMIRIFMGAWLRDMQVKYKPGNGRGVLTVKFASLEAGHMIHFKGAGFRCQKAEGGVFRTFLIGSHNYHPRSGYSDKEHALQWNQPANSACREKHGVSGGGPDTQDMIDYRDRFYSEAQAHFNNKLLMSYPTIRDELDHVQTLSGKVADRAKRAERLERLMYRQSGELRGGKAMDFFLRVLRESGVRDFLGIVL